MENRRHSAGFLFGVGVVGGVPDCLGEPGDAEAVGALVGDEVDLSGRCPVQVGAGLGLSAFPSAVGEESVV